jgi:hypothetical protein
MSDATEYMDIRLAMLGEGTPSYVTPTRTDHGCSKFVITRIVDAVETLLRADVVRLGEVRVLVRWATLEKASPTASRLALLGSIKTIATQVTKSIQETNRAGGRNLESTTGNQPPKRVRGLIDSGLQVE